MTTPDPTRSKAIEVMARQYCADECRSVRVSACSPCRHWDMYKPEANKLLEALQAEGMAVVPVEPSGAMVLAGKRSLSFDLLEVELEHALECWSAMLSASPYGKASMQEASAEAQSAVANTPSMKAGKEESK